MNWKHIKLGDHIDILSGFAFDSSNFNGSEGTPLIRIRDVGKNSSETFYKGDFDNRYLVNYGDMLISMDGEFRIAEWQGEEALLNQRVCKIKPKNGTIDSRYLLHLMPFELSKIEQRTPFVTVKHLSAKDINSIGISLPPLPIQQKIAAILDKADELRKKDQQLLAKYDELLQSIFYDMFGDPVKNEKEWDRENLGNIARNLDKQRRPLKQVARNQLEKRYPYYGASGIIDYVDDYIFDSKNLLVGEDGANLIARATPIAFLADGKYWVNNHAHVLGFSGRVNLTYLCHYINSLDLKNYVTGSAQPKLTKSSLDRLIINCPPIEIQNRFKIITENIELQRNQLVSQINNSNIVFNSLLQDFFEFQQGAILFERSIVQY